MKVVWFREAIDDLEEARNYIARDKPETARRIAARIVDAVDRLAKQPSLGRPGRIPGTRELIVPGTPYILPYRVRREVIEILRVFHNRRQWPDRF